MLLDFSYDEENHIYNVPGRFTLGTSDILSMNGLASYGQIPKAVLDNASRRGKEVHKAVQFFEEGDLDHDTISSEVEPYLAAYLKFRVKYDFEPIGAVEKKLVYEFGEKEYAIGATIDLRGTIAGKPYVLDLKTSAKNFGQAKKQTLLKWRLQLSSYVEATEVDQDFWSNIEGESTACLGRGIVHLNKEGGYDFYDFSLTDDEGLWASMVHVAFAKISNGHTLEKR